MVYAVIVLIYTEKLTGLIHFVRCFNSIYLLQIVDVNGRKDYHIKTYSELQGDSEKACESN